MTQLVPTKPRLLYRPARRCERGMTTAEYAVGTVAVVLFGGVVAKCVTDDWFQQLIRMIIEMIIKAILALLGSPV